MDTGASQLVVLSIAATAVVWYAVLHFVTRARVDERARAQQDRETRFTNAFDFAAIGKAVVATDGRWLQVNRAFCDFVGYSEAELLQLGIQDVTHPDDRAADLKHVRELLDGKVPSFQREKRYLRKDGQVVWGLLSVALVRDAAGTPLYFVSEIQNITDLKRTQQALAESEANHRLLAEHSSDLILRVKPDATLIYVSPASAAVLGYAPEELMTRAIPEFLHPDDLPEVSRLYGEVVRRDERRVITCRVRSRAGDWIWCETSFRAVRDEATRRTTQVIAVCRNVDERVKVAEALAAANEDLARHHAIDEEEKRVAKHVLDRLVWSNQALADRVDTWILPARYFSGDVVAVTETPSKVLHLLLADGTGHGLSAALGALPALQPFYAMSHKGFSIGAIVREMNAKIRELLPPGRFIAATVASIDPGAGVIQVWNGGNPAGLLLNEAGELQRDFPSIHLALGILGDKDFNAHIETASFDSTNQLIMVSDGLVDAMNQQKERFGEERLRRVCGDARPSARLVYLRSVIHGHLQYEPPEDDISVVVARCERLKTLGVQPHARNVRNTSRQTSDYGLHFMLTADQLKGADVVPALCTLFRELHLVGADDGQVFVVLSELFNNALDHGLLGLPSSLKDQRDDPELYLNERAFRLAHLNGGYIQIHAQSVGASPQRSLKLTIRDTGEGFDFASRLDASAAGAAQRHGRGIALVSALCTTLEYRDGGREVEVVLPLAA